MSNQSTKKNNSKLFVIVIIIIIVILLGVLFLTKNKEEQNKVAEPGNEATEAEVTMNADFSSSFLVMDAASIADTREDVIAALGEPESENSVEDAIPGIEATELVYDNGETKVTIRNGRVELIESTNKDRTFAKGIKVGSSQSDLENAFPAGSKIQNSSVPEDSIVYAEVDSEEYQYAKYARCVIKNGKVDQVILSIGD